MKRYSAAFAVVALTAALSFPFCSPALAAKGDGGGKAERAQKETNSLEQKKKEVDKKEKAEKATRPEEESLSKGLEKQRIEKQEQSQKELDKGSEQGRQMREEHRRKWWKFWGE